MKNEFVLAFNEVLEEKQLPKEIILEALQAAMVSAYRRAVNASTAQHVEATIDSETGQVLIYAEKEIVESVEDERTEVTLEDALKVDPEAKLGGMVVVETTPKNFGRVAAQTARQVIQQRIREAERDAQFSHYTKQLGEIVSGVVQAVNATGLTLGLDMKAEGLMPRNQMIQNERFRVHDRVRALLYEIKPSSRGPQIILSRAHRNFLRRLLENEVPEIYHGMVEIRSIAREPGQRSKVAVAALQPGVDPVGACVGIRGVRIQAIVRELNDEKIDVIEYSNDPAVYIAKALSPARVAGVYLNEHAKGAKTATVVVPEDQLSLAIGRDGQNARLAAKLTSWRIDIKSLPEAGSDALHKLQSDSTYAALAANEADLMPQIEMILAKKAEGRPVTPEEYTVLTQFVDRIERGVIRQRQSERKIDEERELQARAGIPPMAFSIPIEDFNVSDRVYAVISEAGYQTVGDLMMQMALDPDAILRLSGMGPKAMHELETAIEALIEQARAAEAPVEVEGTPVVEAPVAEAAPEPVEILTPAASETPLAEAVEAAAIEEASEIAEGEPVPAVGEPEAVLEQAATATAGPEAAAPEGGEPVAAGEPAEEGAEALDNLFALPADVLTMRTFDEEEEEDEDDRGQKKKGKKKKKKFVEVEYDPDADVMLVKKKRKREDWEGSW
ncbi:MAG: transcription termination factor NusA [Anaerolineales bacterium]|jgi:N utilization substance protein A|nr:transcription termination factor NusA [Anaerolineales bacterium]